MKKLQSIKSLEKLSLAEMADVKGGGSFSVSASALGVTISASSTNSSLTASLTISSTGTYSVTLDDKRRDRPGGGITTL